MYSLENNFKNTENIAIQKNNYLPKQQQEDFFLINHNFYDNFKNILFHDKINKFLEKYKNNSKKDITNIIIKQKNIEDLEEIKEFILSKEKDLEVNKDILEIEKGETEDNSIKYLYPTNFNIIDREAYSKILTIIKIEDKKENFLLNFILKDKKIFFKLKNNDCFKTTNNKNYYFYGYDLKTNNDSLEFIPEYILSFSL